MSELNGTIASSALNGTIASSALTGAMRSVLLRGLLVDAHALYGTILGPVEGGATYPPAPHTHPSSDITDFDEAAQDAVSNALADSATIAWDYDDANDEISADVIDGSLALGKLANISTDSLIGRDSGSNGPPEVLTLGVSLQMSGTGQLWRAELVGDVAANPNSNITIVQPNAITNAKLADMSANTVKGRRSTTGDPQDLSADQLVAILDTSTQFLESIRDAIGATLTNTAAITWNYDDPNNQISATIPNDAITNLLLRNSGALSVIGRSANSSGDPADISATAGAGGVFRESGSVLGFGTIATAGLGANVVTNAKLAQMAQTTVKGRASGAGTGDPSDLTASQLLAIIATVDGSGSGLDADTLDGNDSAYFLPAGSYTAADVLAKLLTVDGAGSGLDADLLDGLSSAAFALASHAHAGEDITSGTVADARIASTITRDSEVFGIVLANDGAGSTLDADLLDGIDSTGFALASHTHSGADITSGTVAEARIDSAITRDSEVFGIVLAADGSGSGLDADTVDGSHAAAFQPVDAELTALAGLTSAADKLPYFTGSGTAALTDLTSFGRSLIDDAAASDARSTLGLVIGTNVQAFDATLLSIAALGTAADKIAYTTGVDTWAETALTSFGRSLIDDADAATAQSTLGLVIGTNVQAYDAELAALAGLTSAADKLPYFTGSGTAALTDLTAFARTLLDDAANSNARSTLGLVIGTDVQAYDAELAAIAGLTSAADRLPYFTGSGTASLATFTSAGRAIVDDADASAQRTTLGLGTIATEAEANYALLAGRSGGQTLIGGTASGDDLTLKSTSNATKGTIFLGNAGTTGYDEVNDRFGVGTVSPTGKLQVNGSVSNWYIDTGGNVNVWTRAGGNYFNATDAAGYFNFITGGNTASDGAATLRLLADRSVIIPNGSLGFGATPTISDGVGVDVNGKILRLRTSKTPASASATGNQGEICWDSSNIYVCTATNTWKKVAIATF